MAAKTSKTISEVKTYVVAGSRWGWVIVQVITEDGSYGVGEASLEGRELSVVAAVDEAARTLVGRDASKIASWAFEGFRGPIWSGGPVLQCAMAGIDVALWDLKAKLLDVPLYELIGGRFRDEIKLYANEWWYAGGTPDDVARAARSTVDEGYFGLKFNPFNRQPDADPFTVPRKVIDTGAEYVAAVREAVGPEIDIYVDFNAVFMNVGDVFRAAKALEPFGLGFIEEPLAQENHAAMAELRRRVRIPVAAGERLCTLWDFQKLFAAGAVDVAQPDLAHCGGLSVGLKVAALAEAEYVPVTPHNPNGPLCEAVSAHLATAIPNFTLLEKFRSEPWRHEVVGTPYTVDHGVMRLSDKPGLGIEFDEQAALARPYTSRDLSTFHVRNYTGWVG